MTDHELWERLKERVLHEDNSATEAKHWAAALRYVSLAVDIRNRNVVKIHLRDGKEPDSAA